MDCFLQKEIDNAKFPKLTNRVHYLKHEEGGVQKMCEVMEQYSKKAVKKATKKANITAIKNMLEFKIPKESILKKYTESEYNTAIAELQSESRYPQTKTTQTKTTYHRASPSGAGSFHSSSSCQFLPIPPSRLSSLKSPGIL